jgi:DNA processing protein
MELAGNEIRDLPRRFDMTLSRSVAAVTVPADRPPSFEIGRADPLYPASLCDLPVGPERLWVKGCLPAAGERLVAVVGSRAATGDGCERARRVASELAGAGFGIVSGGAYGIDAAAHEGALAAGAKTYAVFGCGIDVIYPDRHGALFARIASAGGLLSEYPRGTKPRRGQFPARNRIIAALAEAVIVVEAAGRSGALGTAAWARQLGRRLLAMPGSAGTAGLLRVGSASPLTSAADVVAALAGEPSPPPLAAPGPHDRLLAAIHEGADTPMLLCRRLGLPLADVLAALAMAELDDRVRRAGGDTYEVADRAC